MTLTVSKAIQASSQTSCGISSIKNMHNVPTLRPVLYYPIIARMFRDLWIIIWHGKTKMLLSFSKSTCSHASVHMGTHSLVVVVARSSPSTYMVVLWPPVASNFHCRHPRHRFVTACVLNSHKALACNKTKWHRKVISSICYARLCQRSMQKRTIWEGNGWWNFDFKLQRTKKPTPVYVCLPQNILLLYFSFYTHAASLDVPSPSRLRWYQRHWTYKNLPLRKLAPNKNWDRTWCTRNDLSCKYLRMRRKAKKSPNRPELRCEFSVPFPSDVVIFYHNQNQTVPPEATYIGATHVRKDTCRTNCSLA